MLLSNYHGTTGIYLALNLPTLSIMVFLLFITAFFVVVEENTSEIIVMSVGSNNVAEIFGF